MLPRLHFGRCGLRARERLLLIDGRPAPLGARAFDVLLALVERRDRVVGKAELLDLAWPGLIVEENNLSGQISALRKVLGAPAIATIPALGYRFAMAEAELEPDATPAGGRAAALPAPALINLQAQAATRLVAQPVLAHPAHPAEWADPAGRARQAALIGAFAQAAARTVQAHGGVLLAHAGALLVADFTSAHAAAACSHPLHQAAHAASADTNGGQWLVLKIGLIAATPAATPPTGGAHYAATGLADLADPGQTLAAGEIANQLVPPLDGDLQDLGEQHADPVDPPFRVFRLAPPRPTARCSTARCHPPATCVPRWP